MSSKPSGPRAHLRATWLSRGALLLALASCGACGARSTSAAAGTTTDDIASWLAVRNRAACTKAVRCGQFANQRTCESASSLRGDGLLNGSATYDAFFGGVDFYAYLATLYALDPSNAQACLAELASSSCDQANGELPACTNALTALAPVPAGEKCTPPSPYLPPRPCAAGLSCRAGGDNCRVCLPQLAAGESCGLREDCQPGLDCVNDASGMRVCQLAPALGAACTPMLQNCSSNAHCASASNTCVSLGADRLRIGDACTTDVSGTPCQQDLSCQGGVCASYLLPDGAACARDATPTVSTCANFCVFATPDASSGACGEPSLSANTPCSLIGSALYCPAGTYRDTRGDNSSMPAYCMCLPDHTLGQTCTDLEYCAGGPCSAASDGSMRCAEPLADGQPCRLSSDCASGLCDSLTTLCVAQTCTAIQPPF